MSLLVSDVTTRVQRQFGDETNAQVGQADVVRWINDAQREICVQNDINQVTATAATIANQRDYTLPTGIAKLHHISYQGVSLRIISLEEADELISSHDLTQAQGYPSGQPTHAWLWGTTLSLYPAPSVGGASDLKLYYTGFVTDVVNPGDALTIPPQYHNRVVEYCIAQAFELDENYQLAQIKLGQFSTGVKNQAGLDTWQSQESYPSITVSPEDADASMSTGWIW